MKRVLLVFALIYYSLSFLNYEKPKWEFLSTSTIGADKFLKEHPTYDGRGVLIAICDSGVELGIEGLKETSDGKEKIIDVRDFSNQMNVKTKKPVFGDDGSIFLKDEKRLYDFEKLNLVDKNKIFIGYLKEESLKNSEVDDLNGNKKKDDVFGFLLFEENGNLKVVIDTDGDGSLKGEKEYSDFSEKKEYFTLKGNDRFADYNPLKIALNIDREEKSVVFYFADGSHGTHVAGICAGFRIDGQDGYNGIAPGAQILALKIGNNSFSGGATTEGSMISAWRYAVEKARELNMPLIIQMSYGIGSEIEGKSKIEELIEELLKENEDVVATVSCGNEGPGISTAGLPACSSEVLSIGALLNKTTARDIYGADLKNDEMFNFSSRGGEILKPDVVCPGFAASTVPLWEEGRNVMRGTSMAAPQAAGALALLISAALQENLPIKRDIIYASIRRSAKPIKGYSAIEQGYGLVDINRALEVYRFLSKSDEEVFDYTVETKCFEYDDFKGKAVYYRGKYFPKGDERQEIKVFPKFRRDFSEEKIVRFYKAFDIEKEGDFFSITQNSTYMKAKEPAKIYVTFDENRLKGEGLYEGKILLYSKKLSPKERELYGPDLLIPVTVVVPYEPNEAGFFRKINLNVEKAKVKRIFFKISGEYPVSIKISGGETIKGKVSVSLYDPEGREIKYLTIGKENRELEISLNNLIEAGIYELDFYGNYLNKEPIEITTEIRVLPIKLNIEPNIKVKMGEEPELKLEIISMLPDYKTFNFVSSIVGKMRELSIKKDEADHYETFSILENEESVEFEIEFSPEDYNLFTDIAIMILDEDGKALSSDGMSYRFGKISISREEGLTEKKKYKLYIHSAYADDEEKSSYKIKIREKHFLKEPITGESKNMEKIELIPYKIKKMKFSFKGLGALSDNCYFIVKTQVKDREDSKRTFMFEDYAKIGS